MTDETEVQAGEPEDNSVTSDVRAAIEQLSRGEESAEEEVREEPEEEVEAEEGDDEDISDEVDPASEQQEDPSDDLQPPTSWSAEAKTEWSKLSPALQKAVAKRESEMTSGAQKWSEEKRAYDDMLSGVRQAAQRAGVDEKTGLQNLLRANEALERDPENAIRWLAQTYRVDLSKTQSQEEPNKPDPYVNNLQRELHELRNQFQTREQQEVQSMIENFASQPGHEHFETVKGMMGSLIQSGVATDLQDAYDKAVYANPETRKLVLASQTAKKPDAAAEKAKANRAKRGAISTKGSPMGQPAQPKQDYDTVESAVRAAAKQHGLIA